MMPTLVHLWRCSSFTEAWFTARSDGALLNRFPYHFLLDRLGDEAANDTWKHQRTRRDVRLFTADTKPAFNLQTLNNNINMYSVYTACILHLNIFTSSSGHLCGQKDNNWICKYFTALVVIDVLFKHHFSRMWNITVNVFLVLGETSFCPELCLQVQDAACL